MSSCPKCGKELVERVNKKTGEIFMGCTGFPVCKFSKSVVPIVSNQVKHNNFNRPNNPPRWLTRTWEGDLADEDYEETTDYEQICHD